VLYGRGCDAQSKTVAVKHFGSWKPCSARCCMPASLSMIAWNEFFHSSPAADNHGFIFYFFIIIMCHLKMFYMPLKIIHVG